MNIIFMGTPHFAVASLDILLKNNYNVIAVVTNPDKPSGRGQKLAVSPLKQFAIDNNIPILQPEKLNDEGFIATVKELNPDLQIVVAFKKLPKVLWQLPALGTFNLHASLLPDYRGAAPMNWAIINGETETGLTTFFLNDNIDEGKILLSKEILIDTDWSLGELHDEMMVKGAELVLKTVKAIENQKITPIDQLALISNDSVIKKAPKIFKEHCRINWDHKSKDIVNLIRGLSPIPTAFTELLSLKDDSNIYYLKVFKAMSEVSFHSFSTGKILTDNKTFLKISTTDGFVHLIDIQLAGKKRMNIYDFLRGFNIGDNFEVIK